MLYRTTILAALILCLFLVEARAATPVVTVVGDHSPPFRIFERGEASGIYFDTIRELGARVGFIPRFVHVPFKRALTMMRKGWADMMPGPNYSKERASYMEYTGAMLPAEDKAFYYRKPENRITELDDLRGKRVGTTLGKAYNSVLKKVPGIDLEIVTTYELAIQKVLYNRNDIVVLPEFQGAYLLRTRRLKLHKSPFTLKGQPSHICLSLDSVLQGRQRALRDAMEAIVADGTFQTILERYALPLPCP